MATIDIKASTVMVTEKRAAEICSILAEVGIEFTFTPAKNPNPKRNILLKDINWCVREERVVKIACGEVGLNFETATVSDFSEYVTKDTLIKVRDCGKRALEGIQGWLYNLGYALA